MTWWPFSRRRAAPEFELSEGSYDRWLRAHRPPFEWFLSLEVEHQEAIAALGDTHSLRLALAGARAIHDPGGVEMSARVAEGDPEGEAGLAAQLAEAILEKHAEENAEAARASRVPTMAGVLHRQERPEVSAGRPATLFGKAADG